MIKTSYTIQNVEYPVIALSIHNGHDMSNELLGICGISDTDRLREEDPFTERISSGCSNNVTVHTSRFMIDLNRSPQSAVYQKPEDCWGLNVRKNPIPSTYLTELYDAYEDWYRVLDYQISNFLNRHPRLIVFDLHSYNHRRKGPNSEPDPQIENPDIIIGRSNLNSEYYPLVAKLKSLLNNKEIDGYLLDCREDVKFSGGYLSRYLNAKYPQRVISLSIEFKKIYMDEWSGIVDDYKFGRLIATFWDSVGTWLKGNAMI